MKIEYKGVGVEVVDFSNESIEKAAIEWERIKYIRDHKPDPEFALIETPTEILAGSNRKSFMAYIEEMRRLK